MPEYIITHFFSNEGSRNDVRMRVVTAFSAEAQGRGRGEMAAHYTYYVETLFNGSRVYLRRPANLYNGFDFLVCVENTDFSSPGSRSRNYPKHDDIIEDLQIKSSTEPEMYANLYQQIRNVHNCIDVRNEDISPIRFQTGFSSDLIIKTIKWLFIEQDIRYWNYSGRDMLWSGIPRIE